MEKTLTVEERIRRAEQIYERRKGNTDKIIVDKENDKKDIKLLKKMIVQIIVCVIIYFIIYIIQNGNYIFSTDFINKANEILSYDMNFIEMYNNIKNHIEEKFSINKNIETDKKEENVLENKIEENGNNEVENNNQAGIGGAVEENKDEENQNITISEEEQDIINIKNTTTFIKPVEGVISSKYGQREPTTASVPKNHTGTDIATVTGTKIKSATDGQVVLASEEGDYGKHIKIQIGEVSIIYAHCNSLYVKEGDMVSQGQEIAEVGSTGNSTGPHLHFEIRISERMVDPQKILDL